MVRTERMRAPGKKGACTKKKSLRARSGALVRSLARSLARSLTRERVYCTHRGRENGASARVHYDSCIYIRSKNIRARCVPAGPARYFI